MTRAAAIIIEDRKVALIRRERPGETYYLFPGGSVEEGETDVDAVMREVREELGLDVIPVRLAAEVVYRGNVQRYFVCVIAGGSFGEGTGPEFFAPPSQGLFVPLWVRASGLLKMPVYPRAVAGLVLASFLQGWPKEVVRLEDEGRMGRARAA